MAKFTDNNGKQWQLLITVGSLAKVKADAGVNLSIVSKDTSWLEAIYGDPAKLGEILWSLCERQAEAAGVTPEQFVDGLTGEVLGAAGDALVASVCDFFPRSAVAKAIKEKLPAILAQADAKAITAIRTISTDSPPPSTAPASSESTPPN
jgi:hypothetical protein